MSESGLIDYVSVIGSGADTHNTLANCMPPMALPPEPFVHLAAPASSLVVKCRCCMRRASATHVPGRAPARQRPGRYWSA